jgi:hypothetical protein
VEYFKYFGSTITSDTRWTSGIKSKIAMTKGESKWRISSPANWTLNLREKRIKFYI